MKWTSILFMSIMRTRWIKHVLAFWVTSALLGVIELNASSLSYEGWNFNSGNYLFTTDTK